MKFLNITVILISMSVLVACENEESVASEIQPIKEAVTLVETTIKEAVKPTVKLSKTAQIDLEIKRIEELMKTEPTVKGWMLIGDAHMHLKRYKEAAGAYNDAYMLSGLAAEPRKKLKNAMYYVGLEKANAAR